MAYSKDDGGRNAYVETNRRYANKALSMCLLHSALRVVSVDSEEHGLLRDLLVEWISTDDIRRTTIWYRSVPPQKRAKQDVLMRG